MVVEQKTKNKERKKISHKIFNLRRGMWPKAIHLSSPYKSGKKQTRYFNMYLNIHDQDTCYVNVTAIIID